jgi:hypothetical protein
MRNPTPSRLFGAMVRQWVDEFDKAGFSAGCPLAAAAVDCADTAESTRQAVADGFGSWRRPIADALVDMGVPARRSEALATLMISTLEGAILIARAEQDTRALKVAARELGPLLDAAIAAT